MRFCEWENSHRPGLDRARWRWSLWMPARAGGILMHGGAAALLKAHVACGPAAATRRRAVHAAGPSLGRWQWRATVDGGRSRSLQGGPPCGPDGTSLERARPPRQQAGAKPLSSTQFPLPALHLARTGDALHPLCADITTDIRPGQPRRLVETAALRLVPWMQIFQRYCHLLLSVCGASPVVRFALGSGQLRRSPLPSTRQPSSIPISRILITPTALPHGGGCTRSFASSPCVPSCPSPARRREPNHETQAAGGGPWNCLSPVMHNPLQPLPAATAAADKRQTTESQGVEAKTWLLSRRRMGNPFIVGPRPLAHATCIGTAGSYPVALLEVPSNSAPTRCQVRWCSWCQCRQTSCC